MPDPLPPLTDQADRDRFTSELDRNFTVTAPAGVGKTTAIVSRVVALAKADAHLDDKLLPRLAVVTYTRKAADEMRRRTHAKLHEVHAGPDVMTSFNQAFFGTIHSFCLELLRTFGPLAGLPPQFEQAGNLEALQRDFLRSKDTLLACLPEGSRLSLERHGSMVDILKLMSQFGTRIPEPEPPGPAPMVDVAPILNFKPENKRGLKGIEEGQRLAAEWQTAYATGEPCPPPDFDKGSADFKPIFQAAWRPLKLWLGQAYLYVAAHLAREFRDYRVQRGEITYDDQVALAAWLMNHEAAGPAIREEQRLVILDEAQDTDPLQFAVLLNVAGGQWSPGQPMAESVGPPPGRFCMVGDPQQSIYSDRADLPTYRSIHEGLVDQNAADALSFTVTMRCDAEIVSAVNRFFPQILRREDEPGEQAAFVPLEARPNAGPGSFERLLLHPPADYDAGSQPAKTSLKAEAVAISQWLVEVGLEGLGASDWSEVAILTPRNDWAEALHQAIERARLPVQSHSRKVKRADDPVWSWAAALVRIMAHPEDDFEIVGVLREIFALPDGAIAVVKHELRSFLSVTPEHRSDFSGSEKALAVIEALLILKSLHAAIHELALSDAFRVICDTLQLGERLASLPDLDPARIDQGLKRMQAAAMQAEEHGDTLADWSRQLMLARGNDIESDDPAPGQIQLLSCHKSKGLQWEVVITPFFHYPVSRRPENFPRLYEASGGAQDYVAYDSSCENELANDALRRFREETERLAYVTWTRARKRVIAVDAAAYYKNPGASMSWLDLCHCLEEESNGFVWAGMREFAPASEPVTESPAGDDNEPAAAPAFFMTIEPVSESLRAQSQQFPQRILPSSLAQHGAPVETDSAHGHARDESDWQSEPGYPETQDGSSALGGADYGNWWHDSMERGPWGQPIEAWVDYQAQVVPHAPNEERGAQEFAALLSTEEFLWLNHADRQVRAEASLFWPESAHAPDELELGLELAAAPATFAYDGFIDLLAYDASRDAWRIVDWKTDRIFKNAGPELRACYGPQLAAYVTALKVMFSRPVEGYLYSTRKAQWIKL
ncbi:UvrD-helicase domain-containing protein [Cerasicoccus fimbriatus]|uniref:UvrD-helicase domain-containing protein n=1 Tax=Cerasicoccus fimbriatus TaxID=3014554 RepID=UPI0022B3FC5A|nr:UvrD-helicase domain-containing protein [Cerasicoccus sp. TK19100]